MEENKIMKMWYKSKVNLTNLITFFLAVLPAILDVLIVNGEFIKEFGKGYYLTLVIFNACYNFYTRSKSEASPVAFKKDTLIENNKNIS